jgi:segregation and condensation protein A
MDLLLYLVRKEEVDIYDIPIAKITDQYIHYIEILKSLDIELAGDFLVMAATLMQIKSEMLLPRTEAGQLEADELADPRAELIRQLLEYKKFKDAANLLSNAAEDASLHFPRPATIIEQLKPNAEPAVDIEQVSVWDLLEAFDSIMKATSLNIDISRITDETPIDLYQIEVLQRLQTEGVIKFERIFEPSANRAVMIGLFLALLELIREKLAAVEQLGSSEQLYLRALTDESAEQAVQKAILASAEADNEQAAQTQQQKQPPVPIAELPPEKKTKLSHQEQEKQKIESAANNKQEIANSGLT